jgi:hypothetical protein
MDMAQNSKLGGPSLTPEEAADPIPPERPVRVRRPEIGYVDQAPEDPEVKEDPSSPKQAGGDSTPSSKSEAKSNDKPNQSHRKPARTTVSRSSRQAEESSTAPMTDGPTRTTEKESDKQNDFGEFGI